MKSKFVLTAILAFSLASVVMAEEFAAAITKIDGNKITLWKFDKKGKEIAKTQITAEVAPDVAILLLRGGPKGAGKAKAKQGKRQPIPVEDGFRNEVFKNIDETRGLGCTITTDDNGKITKVLFKGG